ncbi:hypothetical protein [uncultured Draconibacterium sp.]|uniref:hypothetical protein n=1 Tax=uncultured Draconibacterium sp. TaxID=1573823 RepID=UPI003260FCEF
MIQLKLNFAFVLPFICFLSAAAQNNYVSLSATDPIAFYGDYIIYGGEKIELGPKAFFIDGQLSDSEAAEFKFVFNSINEAAKQLTNGNEATPMVLYIAPYVYWIDDPDDPTVRIPKQGEGAPYGLEIECEWLHFQGLSKKAENVVLACNRGQTMGAKGNFTMFKIIGNGTRAENITFGNYCNIDLVFPLKPELNRAKRGSAIVQAQLVYCRGDKIFARNTHFISRLNLLPFYGGERTLFDRCHFESTDDALAPKGVYLNCTFEFYSSKPFGHTAGTGAVLLNCDIESFTRGEQYLVKSKGPVTAVDCRLNGKWVSYWGWRDSPAPETTYYNFNNRLNNSAFVVGSKHPLSLVNMAEKYVLNAYRFEYSQQVVYNTYNLLCGNDDWDPMGIKPIVLKAEITGGKKLSHIPTLLTISPTQQNIETAKDTITLSAKVSRFGGFNAINQSVNWEVLPGMKELVQLVPNTDGTCKVIPQNTQDATKQVIIRATTNNGLAGNAVLYVTPRFLEPPVFIDYPEILSDKGQLKVAYKLNMPYPDQSLISWYRCADSLGTNPIKVAVSRFNRPMNTYKLSTDDIGWYMMATVEPKHLRCNAGPAFTIMMDEKITRYHLPSTSRIMEVNLKNMATTIQPTVMPGFWTFDCFKPDDTNEWNDWEANNSKDSWYFGPGINGADGDTGLVQASKGARLRYTPVGKYSGNMKVSFTACPAKTAGQGFSSAKAQYMDVFIQFDTKTLNGYALRLFRTTKYHDAIDCMFVKYINGKAEAISDPVSTSCYRTPCFITVETKGNRITAKLKSSAKYFIENNRPEVKQSVEMEAVIKEQPLGGFGLQHTGSVGSGATLIKDLKLEWE